MVSLKNKEAEMYKKLLNLLKGNYGFYISLVFFIFPLAYVIDGTYPKYILLLTLTLQKYARYYRVNLGLFDFVHFQQEVD